MATLTTFHELSFWGWEERSDWEVEENCNIDSFTASFSLQVDGRCESEIGWEYRGNEPTQCRYIGVNREGNDRPRPQSMEFAARHVSNFVIPISSSDKFQHRIYEWKKLSPLPLVLLCFLSLSRYFFEHMQGSTHPTRCDDTVKRVYVTREERSELEFVTSISKSLWERAFSILKNRVFRSPWNYMERESERY